MQLSRKSRLRKEFWKEFDNFNVWKDKKGSMNERLEEVFKRPRNSTAGKFKISRKEKKGRILSDEKVSTLNSPLVLPYENKINTHPIKPSAKKEFLKSRFYILKLPFGWKLLAQPLIFYCQSEKDETRRAIHPAVSISLANVA